MKKLLFLFIALILTFLSACNWETASVFSENAQGDESIAVTDNSSNEIDDSKKPTLEEKFPEHEIEHITNKLYLVKLKESVKGNTDMHIVTEDGRIINTYFCESINKVPENELLLFVKMADGSAFFINESGDRINKMRWDSLKVWEESEEGALLGKIDDVFHFLDSNGETVLQIGPEPYFGQRHDGLTIASKFSENGWRYGVMKDGKFIIEPQFCKAPIIKKGRIVFNSEAIDANGAEGYIYDYSGKLLRKGSILAHWDFNYMIECEQNGNDPDDVTYSILDYSGKRLYTAPNGVKIDLAYVTMWSPEIMPYNVTLNGEMMHLEKLIENVEYPAVTVEDFKNANGIDPENATVIQTPYLTGDIGRRYEVTDELKEYVKEKLISYLDLANIEYKESDITYVEDEGTFFAKFKIPNSVYNVLSYPDAIYRSVADSGDSCEPLTDPLSDPIILDFCKFTFKTTKGLKAERTSNAYVIFEERNGIDKNALSIARRSVVVNLEPYGGFCTGIYAVDMSDKKIYPTYTLDAISYEEAVKELRNGNYTQPPFNLTEYDCKNGKIEGARLEYRVIDYCGCEECQGNIGYYIPCYSFLIRDKQSPEFVGEALVPAVDINELNELLSSKSLPHVDHYWTEN